MSDLSFNVLSGKFGSVAAALCDLLVLGHRLGIAVAWNLGGGSFGKRIQGQFQSGHVVAKVFLGQAFISFVLPSGHAAPSLGEDVGQHGIVFLLGHARAFPFVGEFVARADGLHAVFNPFVGITLSAVVLNGHLESQLRINHLVDALLAYLGKPLFQRLSLFGRDGLYDTENTFQCGGLSHAVFSVGGQHSNRGTNCPPLGF